MYGKVGIAWFVASEQKMTTICGVRITWVSQSLPNWKTDISLNPFSGVYLKGPFLQNPADSAGLCRNGKCELCLVSAGRGS